MTMRLMFKFQFYSKIIFKEYFELSELAFKVFRLYIWSTFGINVAYLSNKYPDAFDGYNTCDIDWV